MHMARFKTLLAKITANNQLSIVTRCSDANDLAVGLDGDGFEPLRASRDAIDHSSPVAEGGIESSARSEPRQAVDSSAAALGQRGLLPHDHNVSVGLNGHRIGYGLDSGTPGTVKVKAWVREGGIRRAGLGETKYLDRRVVTAGLFTDEQLAGKQIIAIRLEDAWGAVQNASVAGDDGSPRYRGFDAAGCGELRNGLKTLS
jgi:hypothetical protein